MTDDAQERPAGKGPDGAPYPYQLLIGYEIDAWGEGHCRVTMPMRDCHANRHGIPHGGVYAALLDTAMGFAGSYAPPGAEKRYAMTLSMTTNFMSRPKGTLLIAEGRVTGGGRSTFFAESSVTDDSGELIATAIGTFRIRQANRG